MSVPRPVGGRRLRRLRGALLATLMMVLAGCAGWHVQYVGSSAEVAFNAISCASTTQCVAVGLDSSGNPLIVTTGDGGRNWKRRGQNLNGLGALVSVSCPTRTRCAAAGPGAGSVALSGDGGRTWTDRPTVADVTGVVAVSCADASTCYAAVTVSENRLREAVIKTTDGGLTWAQVFVAGTGPGGADTFYAFFSAIACPSALVCYAGGTAAERTYLAVTMDGGVTWDDRTVLKDAGGTTIVATIGGISCATTRSCMLFVFAGATPTSVGYVVTTDDGGATWLDRTPALNAGTGGAGAALAAPLAVSCSSRAHCTLVGRAADSRYGQPVVGTGDGGASWRVEAALTPSPAGSHQSSLDGVSCPTDSACWAAGYTPPSCTETSCNLGGPGFVIATKDDGYATPQLDGLSPRVGAAGTTVTVRGLFLGTGSVSVYFGTTRTRAVAVLSPTRLRALAPPGAPGSIVDVRVATRWGLSPLVVADQYTYPR